MRYLAELSWAPPAMAHNHELEWREVDEMTVEVASRVASGRGPLICLKGPFVYFHGRISRFELS